MSHALFSAKQKPVVAMSAVDSRTNVFIFFVVFLLFVLMDYLHFTNGFVKNVKLDSIILSFLFLWVIDV